MKDLDDIALPTLADGRLVVRPPRPDDAPAVAALCRDETAQRWLDLPTPYTLADAEKWIAAAGADWPGQGFARFAIDDAASGELIGTAGVRIDVRRCLGELGYLVKREARGRGVATRTVRLLAAWSLDVLELNRVQIRCDPANEASRRVPEGAGFRFEGVLRADQPIHGVPTDSAVFSLLPTDPRT